MSTHSLDVSGSRPLTTTTNDPSRTAATMSAKMGDDVVANFGNFDSIEIPISSNAKVEIVTRMRDVRRIKRDEHGNEIREDGKVVYEDTKEEQKTIRLNGSIMVIATTEGDAKTPHTSYSVRDLSKQDGRPVWIAGEEVKAAPVEV